MGWFSCYIKTNVCEKSKKEKEKACGIYIVTLEVGSVLDFSKYELVLKWEF